MPHAQITAGTRYRGRIVALTAGLILQALIAAPVVAASAGCKACGHGQPLIEHWPICSPAQIDASSSQAGGDLTRTLRMQAGAFAGLGFPRPGRAQMELSGLINAGGASCARHILARANPTSGAQGQTQDVLRSQIMGVLNGLTSAGGDAKPKTAKASRHVVLQIYTPNIQIQQSGLLVDYDNAPYAHNGIGGWVPNGYANLILELPHTRPEDLRAGKRYPAVAHYGTATSGWLYRDWRGQYIPYYPKSGPGDQAFIQGETALVQEEHNMMAKALTGYPSMPGGSKGSSSGTLDDAPTVDDVARQYAFQGTQRYAYAPLLKGTVTIDRITRGSLAGGIAEHASRGVVAGHFDVHGTGKLRAERFVPDYDDNTGHLDGDRQVGQHDSTGPLKISGQFLAPNFRPGVIIGSVGQTVVVGSDSAAARKQKFLHITAHSPRIAERNVDWKKPQICVTFDAPVDLDSLNDRDFYLEYRDADGTLQTVAAYYARVSPQTVRLVPTAALKDGVRYRVRLQAGDNGIRGREGRPLEAGYSWNFYTMVNLDDDEEMRNLSPLIDHREGIEAHLFQVTRDTRLVPGKPTLARVYVKWNKRSDVAKDWQVKKFPAVVQIHGRNGKGPVLASARNATIKRPDQYTQTDKRFARNTVNLFNMNISGQPGTIVAEVRPRARCQTKPHKFFSAPKPLEYSPLHVTLNVTYYFIPAGKWRNGVPPADRVVAERVVAESARFATQNMPILGVHMRPGGVMPLSEGWKKSVQSRAKKHAESARVTLMHMLEDRMSTPDARRSDIIVGLMPYSLVPLGGETYENGLFDDTDPSQFPIPAVAMSIKPEVARLAAVTHEFGHVFGLEHVPHSGTTAERRRVCASLPTVAGVGMALHGVPIEGFRMAAGGHSGANKSVVEGNAQSTLGLLPLMYPCQGSAAPIYADKRTTFISDGNYKRLLTNMARFQSVGLFAREHHGVPVLLAANNAGNIAGPGSNRALAEAVAATRPPPARGLLVAGRLSPHARIDWVRHYSGRPRKSDDHGDWRLQAIAADGRILAQQRFAPLPDDNGDALFRIAMDGAQTAQSVRLYHGDKQVAHLSRSKTAPKARITSVTRAGKQRLTIAWTSSDDDGDTLTHQLLYAPSTRGPWVALTGRDPSRKVTVARRLLAPGPSPTLKLIASDGFNETTTTRPVRATAGLHVLAHSPAGDSEPAQVAASADDIYAIFNTDLASGAITTARFTLKNAAGRSLGATVQYRASEHMATLSPKKALIPGTVYTVTLAAEIADRYGDTLGKPLTWRFIPKAPTTPSRARSPGTGNDQSRHAPPPTSRPNAVGGNVERP